MNSLAQGSNNIVGVRADVVFLKRPEFTFKLAQSLCEDFNLALASPTTWETIGII